MPLTLFGLDGEMSDAGIDDGGRLIQIGIAAFGPDTTQAPATFSMLLNPGEMGWATTAEAVHGYTIEQVRRAAPADIVDAKLYDWLLANGANEKRRANTIPIGFNVGSFDMPHLHLVLPRSASLFSRRTIDLNALCFTLDGAELYGQPANWKTWKKTAGNYARVMIDTHQLAGQAHDAGFDALLHLYAWEFLRLAMHGADVPFIKDSDIPANPVQGSAQALLKTYGAEQASTLTGVPEEFINGWASGGRATRTGWIEAILELASRL